MTSNVTWRNKSETIEKFHLRKFLTSIYINSINFLLALGYAGVEKAQTGLKQRLLGEALIP